MLQGWRTRNCNGLNLTASVVRFFGHYGVGYGPYVQLPFYGSFTLRDDGGDMADGLYPVLSWLTWPMSVGKWTLEGIETRAQLLDSDRLWFIIQILILWCAKRTSSVMISSLMAANSNRRKIRTRKRFRMI